MGHQVCCFRHSTWTSLRVSSFLIDPLPSMSIDRAVSVSIFPKFSRPANINIDGPFVGTTFVHLYLMTHPGRMVSCLHQKKTGYLWMDVYMLETVRVC